MVNPLVIRNDGGEIYTIWREGRGFQGKSSFDETKEETNQEHASVLVDETSQGAADVQILADIEGTNATHLIILQTIMHAGI